MLVLTRKPGEKLIIGKNITVTVLEVHGNRVRLGFEAPMHVSIKRSELIPVEHEDVEHEDVEHEYLEDPELGEIPSEWYMEWELDAVPC